MPPYHPRDLTDAQWDVTLNFRGEWPTAGAASGLPKSGATAESWLAVSRALAADQAHWFKTES